MRVLFDTNIVIDVYLLREPFLENAQLLFDAVDGGVLTGLLGATSVTTVFYLVRKKVGSAVAQEKIGELLTRFAVAPVGRAVIEDALALGFSDFEDAVLHEAARHARADALVTRNVGDFQRGSLSIYTPDELLRLLDLL